MDAGAEELFDIELTDMANGGDAVGRMDNSVIFVRGGIAGELVRAIITEQRHDFRRAQVVEILRPSPDRIPETYPDLVDTGGLQWQHIAYPAQLMWKSQIVTNVLQRIGKIAHPPVQMTIGTPFDQNHWQQRTVAQFAVSIDGAIGFKRMASNEVLDMPTCPIVHPRLDNAYQHMRQWFLHTWGEDIGHFIERFTLRVAINSPQYTADGQTGPTSSHAQLSVLASIEARPGGELALHEDPQSIADTLLRTIPSLSGVVILGLPGRKSRIVAGQEYILEQVHNKIYRISAGSFFQVNATQTPVLVQKVLALAAPRQHDTILDGYSGVGLFSLILSDHAKEIIAIESQPSAVSDAKASSAFNHVSNVTFAEGLLERLIGQINRSAQKVNIVLVDPPRAGCHPKALQSIKSLSPRTFVYISCDPATLARDLHLFLDDTYRLTMVQPIDMFPNTPHIETVSLIERR